MAVAFVRQRIRSLTDSLCRFWRRSRTALIACVATFCGLATVSAASLWAINTARNGTISALTSGHDVVVATNASPEVLFARVYFLMTHNRLDDAQQLVSMLDLRANKLLRTDLHYNVANARLKLAFDKIETGDFDAAGALVGLAREDYREALLLDPDFWNARFNFDVASRLVRQYPAFGFAPDERRRGPGPLWTELPNKPRGEP